MSDGIDVHFDEKRGVLELDCGSKEFGLYLETARSQVSGVPGIQFDRVREIQIREATKESESTTHWQQIATYCFAAVAAVILSLAIIGLIFIVSQIANIRIV